VTGTGRQRPSERSRRARDRAWARARPGSGHLFTVGLLWSSLGHIFVLGALVLHLAGRPADIPGLEIFAAEPPAEMDQPLQKPTIRTETLPAGPLGVPHPKMSPRATHFSPRVAAPTMAETRRETETTSAPLRQVPDAPVAGIREEPVSPRLDIGAAPISPATDHAELQPPPQAEPTLATSSPVLSDDASATASLVGEETNTDAPAVAATPIPPVASSVAAETKPSAPPMSESNENPAIAGALTPEAVPSRAPARIEPLAPPAVPTQSGDRTVESYAERPTQPEQLAPRPATPPVAVSGSGGRTGIILTSPREGLQLTPDDPPVVIVEGEVEDTSISTVILVANGLRLAVPVHAGRFRRLMPILESLVRLRVETSVNGTIRQSSTVTVRSTAGAQFGVIVFDWPTDGGEFEIAPSAIWRATPERLDGPTYTTVMRSIPGINGQPGDAFYVRMLKPGVYTFVVRSRSMAPTEGIRPTLYVPAAGTVIRRELETFSLSGAGRRAIARVLLPHGVFWDQDEWFSGRSDSVDTEMKFRFPEGISWVERKAGPR
jgi:hypothetical protein